MQRWKGLERSGSRTLAKLGLACAAALAGGASVAAELPNGVAAGDVTSSAGVLWARASVPGWVRFEVSRREDFRQRETERRYARDVTEPLKVALQQLEPGTTYYYRATDAAGRSSAGHFRTAPPACAETGVRFGVSGDWRPELAPYPSIRNIPGRDLDFFVKNGDTIYAENYSVPGAPIAATLAEYRAKHAEVLTERQGLNTWRDARASTALLATIDDHEVINDFAGGAPVASDPRFSEPGRFINETQRYRDGLQAFFDYMPIRDTRYGRTGDARTTGKPRLYRARLQGNAAMTILLDNRSFRDAPLPPVANPFDPLQVGQFLGGSFNPSRTMLGAAQLDRLLQDLATAERAGIVWKFVVTPEPIENLGVLAGEDRFEGYAAERSKILDFIRTQGIRNVVFITADIHGTIVNNLTYQTAPGTAQIPVQAFEVVTGAVAFDEPFGQTVVGLAAGLGLVSPGAKAFYNSLPIAPDADGVPNDKDDFLRGIVNSQLLPLGYDPLGLDNSTPATLLAGGYVAAHTYGWTEFEVDPLSKSLRVTTYGIDPYDYATLQADPGSVTARTPRVTSSFSVQADVAGLGSSARREQACRRLQSEQD
jgi:phosphodiesterase/alkaline phosphatase D-like protein